MRTSSSTAGSAAGSVDGGCDGSCCCAVALGGEGELELYGRETAEAALPATTVVGALDPLDDGVAELLAGGPAAAVEHVGLEQVEERLHGGVVTGRGDSAHRAVVAGGLEHGGLTPGSWTR